MRRKIFTLTLLGVLLSAGGILMITGNTQISQTERRQLAQWTRPTKQGILSGSWMDAAEQAAADQFPLRDLFRQGKAQFVYHVLLQADHDGIYFRNGSAAKLDYPLDEASVSHLLDVMLRIQQKYLNGTSVRVYYSIIPDKNYYLADWYPTMDYDRLKELTQVLPMTYIDLFPCLTGSSYYRTDPHWRQEALESVARTLASAMQASLHWDFVQQDAGSFSGAYAGQSGLPLKPDRLTYLTGNTLTHCTAYDMDGKIPIYDWDQIQSRDPYEFFLSGASPVQYLENVDASTERELVIFRDSFGSSLAPLLVSGYRKITLIDLRYVSSDLLDQLVTFEEQDVLFLYSTLLWNQSGTIK